jgi:hypothetical protein
MASSSDSNSGLYRCPDDICGETFDNLRNFFNKQHWEKHEKRCPMAGCMASFKKRDSFMKHWLVKATHLEYLGLPEQREVCSKCGESYIKQYKGNHKRDCGKPKNKKRTWDEMENELAPSGSMHEPLRVINESYGDGQSIAHPDGDGIPQGSPTWNDISGSLGLAGHGPEIEADLGEIPEWLMDLSNPKDPLLLSTEFKNVGSQPEIFDYELGGLMETISPSSQQQQCSARLADEVASRVPQLGMELPISTAAANDTTTLMLLSPTTGLSDSDMIVIPSTTEFAGANDVTFQKIVQPAPRDFDRPNDGHFPGINTTYDFEQPGFMLTVLENTGSHPPVIDRYRLDQRRYEPAPAGSRTMFTYSQEVAVKRSAPGMTPQSITVPRQWLRKVKLLRRIRAKRLWRLRIVDRRIDVDAQLVKSTRIVRVSKFHFSDHISIHTDRFEMFEDDHPAFVYCKKGHWQALNEMLSKKEVTIADVNPHGQTLLHVSKILLTLSLVLDIKA